MSIVHASHGKLEPISLTVRSEPAIVAGMAKAVLTEDDTPWAEFAEDYTLIRKHIEKTIAGFDNFEQRATEPGGFYLPNNAKERRFAQDDKAPFSIHPLEPLELADDQLVLMTIRSHDQFNTTIYGMDDRYRGVRGERRVVFLNREDMTARGLEPEQPVNLTSHWHCEAKLFLALPYELPRGDFPETNVLVPLDSTARVSNTPFQSHNHHRGRSQLTCLRRAHPANTDSPTRCRKSATN